MPHEDFRQSTIERYFDHTQVTLPSSAPAEEIIKIFGGEAALIKALTTNTATIFVGKKDVTTSNGFELGASESVEISYTGDKIIVRPVGKDGVVGVEIASIQTKEPTEFIRLYGISGTASMVVCTLKVP